LKFRKSYDIIVSRKKGGKNFMDYFNLSERQVQILDYIKSHQKLRGYPPSVREIGKEVGLSSSSTVHGHLAQLEEKGYIRRDPTKPRAIEILAKEQDDMTVREEVAFIPIIGKITAGEPILATENIEDSFPVPVRYINNDKVFALSVRGDSMIEKGIFDGDLVLVRQQPVAYNGEIVVALLGDEATVKTFYKEGDHIRLQPENSLLSPILVKDVTILGKVIGVFRWM
jgi:repressor LexA